MLRGTTPHPYLRTHDPVQKFITATISGDGGATSLGKYLQSTLHFWREVSLAGLTRTGRAADECCALLFECAAEFAHSEEGITSVATAAVERSIGAAGLNELQWHLGPGEITHRRIVAAMQRIHAPLREQSDDWANPVFVVRYAERWFWAGFLAGSGESLASRREIRLRFDRHAHFSDRWRDRRLHAELIRRSARTAGTSSPFELMAHPVLRLARLNYPEGSAEQAAVLRFVNHRAIEEGFTSEEDSFGDAFSLGKWVRDARAWASASLKEAPTIWRSILSERGGEGAVDGMLHAFTSWFGRSNPATCDDFEATKVLLTWARALRGFDVSGCRGEAWEFLVVVVDMALWQGWMFPPPRRTQVSKRETP